MGHVFIPGLKVARSAVVRRRRLLPIRGSVVVKEGDQVKADQVVARTELPGKVRVVNVMNQLGITAAEVTAHMLKRKGERVAQGEPLAESKPLLKFLGFLKSTVKSPIEGVLEEVSDVTGQAMLREPPEPLGLDAYIDGRVVEVAEGQGVTIEAHATHIQGIFGVGGERRGEIEIAVERPDRPLEADAIRPEQKGKVVVGGSLLTMGAVEAARRAGVAALVAGGMHDRDLRALLGYDIGVAITGTEAIGITLILTEGFGTIPMARRTFDLLGEIRGRRASLSGATQIRAGVIRPEIIVAREGSGGSGGGGFEAEGIRVGTLVRAIREPHFGRIGKVASLPPEPVQVETESTLRVMTVDFGDGSPPATIPRTNVELIEE
jgi:hypothetical protein